MITEQKLRQLMREELTAHTVPKLMKTKEVAVVLGITESCLNHWRVDGKKGPKHIILEGSIRYDLADLNSYLSAKKISSQESKNAEKSN